MSGSLNAPNIPLPGRTKAELRKQFLADRRALSTEEVERRSQLIAQHFFNYAASDGLTDTPGLVHTFLPIQRQNEVNTWLIIKELWAVFRHINTTVPVTDFQTGQLRHYLINADTSLIENAFGIPEPLPADQPEASLSLLKAVLVPLLAFDKQGHRVGYGGGFYDRFLAQCPADCLKIGLSLFEPVERISDVSATDVPLDSCITQTRVYWFGQ